VGEMSLEEIMKQHGFRVSASCAGQAWYTKFINHNGRRAYITVMDKEGEGLPQQLDDPVVVAVYDLRSGDELKTYAGIDSLRDYLDSLRE
jgi:hypothetical protein